jgi:hypothetical protein
MISTLDFNTMLWRQFFKVACSNLARRLWFLRPYFNFLDFYAVNYSLLMYPTCTELARFLCSRRQISSAGCVAGFWKLGEVLSQWISPTCPSLSALSCHRHRWKLSEFNSSRQKQISIFGSRVPDQGCQIFLDTIYQNGEMPNYQITNCFE